MLSLAAKFMNKLLVERDWGAMEVCHLLLNIPLQQGSRQVISLDCRPESEAAQPVEVNDGEVKAVGKSVLEKYKERPPELGDVDFITFLREHNHRPLYQLRPRAPKRLINYFPAYKSSVHIAQFPLTVAWAITIHKSQGITVAKALLNIARGDFVPGLSYVL
jgi:hypothetical protein